MKVYYSGNFWGHAPYERAGTAYVLNTRFQWGGYEWLIPAVYDCTKGVVLDICRRVSISELESFFAKWKDADEMELTPEQREQAERENPMEFPVCFEMSINGYPLSGGSWCGNGWQPCMPDFNDKEAEELIKAYALDKEFGWYFYRVRVPGPVKRHFALKTLSLHLSAAKQYHSCQMYFIATAGCQPFDVEFTHPVTGISHTLHILECRRNILPKNMAIDGQWKNPRHFAVLYYDIIPALPKEETVMVQELDKGDHPCRISSPVRDELTTESTADSSESIVGGADGPVSVFLAYREPENTRRSAACSALHVQPVRDMKWGISVGVIPCEATRIDIRVNSPRAEE